MARELLFLATLTVLIAGASYAIVKLVRVPLAKAAKGVDSVPLSWEMHLKDGLKKYLENDSKVLDDKVITAAVDSVRNRLLAHVADTVYKIEVVVVESDQVNAVTFPGGLIVVFTPLLRLTSSPEELAAVLAHEIGHVEHRDPIKQIVKELGVSTVLSMVNGGRAAPMLETMVKDFVNVQYTREQERAADQYGLRLLADSHINPSHFAKFMENLAPDTAAGKKDRPEIEYFSTHPDVHARIDSAYAAAKRFDVKTEKRFNIDWRNVKRRLPSVFDGN
jgi:predicted Zn-dependent protease